MFVINEDKSIYVTRGDMVFFSVMAVENGLNHVFKKDDVVRFKVFEKKACENVVLQKDTVVLVDTETVDIVLEREDTKIGEVISKPADYWYEVELNPFTEPQTIIGYDDDGAKIFKLYPEGDDLGADVEDEDFPVVDDELDAMSTRPIQNRAVAVALEDTKEALRKEFADADANLKDGIEKQLEGYLKPSALTDYVKNTDYATSDKGGVVKVGSDSMGVKLNSNNTLVIASAGVSEINAMASANRPITPYYLQQAVKTGLVKNTMEWSEEEQLRVREVIDAAGTKDVSALSNNKIGYTDVVDNLLGTATNLPLSANQGRLLDEKIIEFISRFITFNEKTQATTYGNCYIKYLKIEKLMILHCEFTPNTSISSSSGVIYSLWELGSEKNMKAPVSEVGMDVVQDVNNTRLAHIKGDEYGSVVFTGQYENGKTYCADFCYFSK